MISEVENSDLGNVTIRLKVGVFERLPDEVRDELILYTLACGSGWNGNDLGTCDQYFEVRHWLAPDLIRKIQDAVGFRIISSSPQRES